MDIAKAILSVLFFTCLLSCSEREAPYPDFTIVQTYPQKGETNVCTNEPYLIEFSDRVEPFSAQNGVYIEDSAGTRQNTTIWVDAKSIFISSDPALQFKSNYSLFITTAVRSVRGKSLFTDHVISFSTAEFNGYRPDNK